MANTDEMLQEVADKKAAEKAEKAYMKSLTSTVPAPAPTTVKKAKGGMTASQRADGCCERGKTRGKMY